MDSQQDVWHPAQNWWNFMGGFSMFFCFLIKICTDFFLQPLPCCNKSSVGKWKCSTDAEFITQSFAAHHYMPFLNLSCWGDGLLAKALVGGGGWEGKSAWAQGLDTIPRPVQYRGGALILEGSTGTCCPQDTFFQTIFSSRDHLSSFFPAPDTQLSFFEKFCIFKPIFC